MFHSKQWRRTDEFLVNAVHVYTDMYVYLLPVSMYVHTHTHLVKVVFLLAAFISFNAVNKAYGDVFK